MDFAVVSHSTLILAPGRFMKEIDQFITHIEQNEDLAPGTVLNCRSNMRLFSQWLQDRSLTIATVTHADMKAYRDELKIRYKPSTINRSLCN